MSLEESMKELAASNRELAASNLEYAATQKEAAGLYAQLIDRLDGASIDPQAKAAPEKEVAKPRGRPKKEVETKAEPEDDGLGGDDGDDAVQRTSDDVKAILKKFKEAGGAPRDIMSKFGAKAFPEIKEADFNAVYEATEKALDKL